MEIIEEFMESALAQWVRHLSFISRSTTKGQLFIFQRRGEGEIKRPIALNMC